MAIIRNVVVKIGADITALQKGLQNAQKQMNKMSRNLSRVGKNLTASVSAPLAGLGIIAVKTASDFEQSMANAASVSGATAEELEKMKQVARDMGKSTVFSDSEAADAMYYMASAGYKAEQMGKSIKPILDLAAATQSDLAFSTDTVIATLNQFGLEADDAGRVTNVFAATIGNSQATLDKLANSMRYVGPVANSLGYSLEETTAALGLLYNAGFKGEQTGTILRGALSKLMKPTKEVNSALAEMGLKYDDVNPSLHSIADIAKVLGEQSLTTSQAVRIFGQEAGPGMMALISKGSDALIDMESKITGTDAAAVMAEKQLDTFQGSLKLLKSALEEVAIQLGNTLIPTLQELLEKYIQPAVKWFSELSEETKMSILKFAALAAAVGPVLLVLASFMKSASTIVGIVSSLSGWINGLMAAFVGTAETAGGLGAALAFISGPVGWVIAGIAALTAVFLTLYNTNEEFRNKVKEIWNDIKETLGTIFNQIKELGLLIFNDLKEFWNTWGDEITAVFSTVFETVMGVFKGFLKFISGIIDVIAGLLTGDMKQILKGMQKIFEGIFDAIQSSFKGFINLIIDGLNFMAQGLNTLKIDIPDWVPKIGGETLGFNIPKIPKLAAGGIVTSPILALLGEKGPEAVLPLSTGYNGGTSITINITGNSINEEIDIDDIGSRLVEKMRLAGVI